MSTCGASGTMAGDQLGFTRLHTLAHARDAMQRELADEGQATCPCCERVVRVYHRRLHAEMALWLIKLVRKYREEPGWYQTVDLLAASGSHLRAGGTNGTLLVHWGLIERATACNEAGAPVGSYRPTTQGLAFVENRVAVPACVYLLDNKRTGASDECLSIRAALGDRFSYEELMSGYEKIDRPQADAPGY